MEKTINFSVLKEKIIKTDELLKIVLEKNKTLDKLQNWNQHLKTKLDLNKNETNKLKLRCETLQQNLVSVEKNYECLNGEHDKLKTQFNQLENESGNTINNLQVSYQLANQELKDYKEKVEALEKQLNTTVQHSPPKPKKSPVKKRKQGVRKRETTPEVQNDEKILELRIVNEKLLNENSSLKSEADNLRKQLIKLSVLEDNTSKIEDVKSQLVQKEQEILQLTTELDLNVTNKRQESTRLTTKIKKLEEELCKLQSENERLQDENSSYKVEIAMLQDNPKETTIPQETQVREDTQTPTDAEVSAIMKEVVVPAQMSPLRASTAIDRNHTSLSPVEPPTELNQNSTRIRHLRKNRRFFVRRKPKQVDLFGALLALKKANINFVISSDSLTPARKISHQFVAPLPPKPKPFERKKVSTLTKDLNCSLCCNSSYMVLKHCPSDEDSPLLGFVGVKSEIGGQSSMVTGKEKGDLTSNPQSVQPITENSIIPYIEGDNTHIRTLEVAHKTYKQKPKVCKEKENEIRPNSGHSRPKTTDMVAPETDPDEGYSSYRRENSPLLEEVANLTQANQLVTRRSKRKSTSKPSVIKKTKVTVNNKSVSPRSAPPLPHHKLTETTSKTDPKAVSESLSITPKSPKTSFKRPVCSTRRSPRLVTLKEQPIEPVHQETIMESPRSPSPERPLSTPDRPVSIPTDTIPEKLEKMPPSKIEMLFNKLVIYSAEEAALNEVVREFSHQEPEYIAEAILERVSVDIHDAPDTKYSPAPLMTDVQRTMLGFMSKLEKSNVLGVFDHYLTLAEQKILTCSELHEFGPVTRLYLAICKLQKKLTRMRKLCCDVFYFCGDFAVPFLFMVLTSWTEVMPHEADSKDMAIARVWVQIVLTRECNKPGYNLLPLRDLLNKFYGYPTERWDFNEFFTELFHGYLRNPGRSSDFALLLYCKSRPEKWVYEKIEEHLKPIVSQKIADNFKATLIILIGNLYNRFSSKSEVNYLPKIRDWLSSLVTETTPDVVKRSAYLCLNRLKKK